MLSGDDFYISFRQAITQFCPTDSHEKAGKGHFSAGLYGYPKASLLLAENREVYISLRVRPEVVQKRIGSQGSSVEIVIQLAVAHEFTESAIVVSQLRREALHVVESGIELLNGSININSCEVRCKARSVAEQRIGLADNARHIAIQFGQ